MNSALRARLRILVVVILGALALSEVPLALAEVFFVQQTTFGIDLDSTSLLVSIDDPRAAKAGLHDGDRLQLAKMSNLDRIKLLSPLQWPVGTPLTVIVRDQRSALRTVELRAFADTPIDLQRCVTVWSNVAMACLWVLVAAIIVITRPSLMSWGFYFFCLGHHPMRTFGFYLGPPWVAASIFVIFALLMALAYAGIVVFAARFPRGNAESGWKYFEFAALPVFLSLFAIYLYTDLPMLTGRPRAFDVVDPVDYWIIGAVGAAVLVALLVKLVRLHGPERTGMAWVFAGYAGSNIGYLAWLYHVSTPYGTAINWAATAVHIVGQAGLPLCVGYAIVWRRAFGLGFLTNRALVYGFFTATVSLCFGIIDWLVSAQLAYRSLGVGIALAVAFGAGLLLQARHRRAIRLVDRIFLPQRYAAGVELDRIREAIQRGVRRTDEDVVTGVAAALGLASVAVFGRTSDGGFVREASWGWTEGAAWHVFPSDELCRTLTSGPGLVQLSEHDVRGISVPPADARPRIAIAFGRRGRIERAILIGSRQSGTRLDRDEVRGLEAVFAGTAA